MNAPGISPSGIASMGDSSGACWVTALYDEGARSYEDGAGWEEPLWMGSGLVTASERGGVIVVFPLLELESCGV